MFNAILVAKESIYLEMYIFQDDMVEFDFLKLLKEKAKEGLRIRIILDSFGSANLSKKNIIEIKESGIELFFLSYFLHRTHRKILIVDENFAFIGGVNFHQSSSLWNDLVVQIKGEKLISSIIKSFAKVYYECGGTDQKILDSRVVSRNKIIIKENEKHKIRYKMRDWLVDHSPVKNKFRLKKIYTKHLLEAKKEIIISTPYFMPRRWLIGLLHQAHLRGVYVEILIPQSTDYYIIDRINYFYMSKLARIGINFYSELQMNHAKIITIDSKEAIVGSNNMDYLSFELNSEVGIFFNDQDAIHRISRIIEGWKKEAVLFDVTKSKMKWLDYILFPILNLFTRFL